MGGESLSRRGGYLAGVEEHQRHVGFPSRHAAQIVQRRDGQAEVAGDRADRVLRELGLGEDRPNVCRPDAPQELRDRTRTRLPVSGWLEDGRDLEAVSVREVAEAVVEHRDRARGKIHQDLSDLRVRTFEAAEISSEASFYPGPLRGQ